MQRVVGNAGRKHEDGRETPFINSFRESHPAAQKIMVTAMSYQDPFGQEPEKLYHGFILGLMVHLESEYDVRSNRESGYGRAEMLIRPKKQGKPGIVMEFKVREEKEDIDTVLKDAATQVRDRKYANDLIAAGASPVYESAMVFDGKQAWVKRVEELLG